MKRYLLLMLAPLLTGAPALAQSPYPPNIIPVDKSGTVGTTATVLAPATTKTRIYLELQNLSTTATLYCTYDGSTPVAGAIGTFQYLPGNLEYDVIQVEFVPAGPVTCISTAAGTAVTLKVFPA